MTAEELCRKIIQFGQERYRERLTDGIELVDKIIDWLNPVRPGEIDLADAVNWAKKARDEFKRIHYTEP